VAGPPNRNDVLGLMMAFEVYAAFSKRVPLITELCRNHRLRALAVTGIVLAHLIQTIPPTQGATSQ
jgi:hypothetical protein